MPLFRHLKLVSVYEYLELRFDLRTRLVLSGLFFVCARFRDGGHGLQHCIGH
jgi:uncharacterized sodium:solute symporter family permease YidK